MPCKLEVQDASCMHTDLMSTKLKHNPCLAKGGSPMSTTKVHASPTHLHCQWSTPTPAAAVYCLQTSVRAENCEGMSAVAAAFALRNSWAATWLHKHHRARNTADSAVCCGTTAERPNAVYIVGSDNGHSYMPADREQVVAVGRQSGLFSSIWPRRRGANPSKITQIWTCRCLPCNCMQSAGCAMSSSLK